MENIEYWNNVLFSSQTLLIQHMFNKNLLKQDQKCCNEIMSMIVVKDKGDGYIFRCKLCKKKRSIRSGSFFSQYKLPLGVIMKAIISWSEECLQKDVIRTTSISKATVQNIYKELRRICLTAMEQVERLGSNDSIVQIDECLLTKRKYNVGRMPCQKWIFGAIDSVSKDFIIKHIDNRTRESLRGVIIDTIREDSNVHSDQFRTYMYLFPSLPYNHSSVNHSRNYVDPETGVNTNLIENLWMRLRLTLRRRFMRNFENLDEYLAEFSWRKRLESDPERIFVEILNQMIIN